MEMQNNNVQPQGVTPEKGKISSALGSVIIILVAIIAGLIIFQYKSTMIPAESLVAPQRRIPTSKTEAVPSNAPVQEEVSQNTTSSNLDIDYEIRKMDEQNDSVSESDFGATGMADADLGI